MQYGGLIKGSSITGKIYDQSDCIFVLLLTAKHIGGEDVTMLASMCKLKGGRLCREVSDACLQYWGGMGFTNEVLVSRFYRYVYISCNQS